MFLPIILMHRYGWLGFVIFSVPNVLGCAAFGYVLKTPERSKALVEKYKTAISLFALVTIAFHIFFIAMLSLVYINDFSFLISAWLPFCILALCACVAFVPTKIWPILAAGLWCFSIIAGLSLLPFNTVPQGNLPWQEAVWLLPITTFGFFLSPYLDPTFHRALQSSPSKHSFGVFGITFLVMIGFTTTYLGIAQDGYDNTLFVFSALLSLHLLLQSMFTISVHMKEGIRIVSRKRKKLFVGVLALFCVVAVAVAHRFGGISPSGNWLDGWQDDYLRFFVFYGLVFPGIVAVFMFTNKKFTPLRTTLFAFALLFSMPLLEIGYLQGSAWLTVLPVILLITWAFASRPRIA